MSLPGRYGNKMSSKFWKNKKVLITGSEGFLGSNLVKRLLSYGAEVAGLDIKTKRKNTVLTKEDYKKIKVIKGDVANYNLLKSILSKYKPEYIFHLAAEAIVDKCYKDPMKTFSSNIRGTWTVLEASRNSKRVKGIIIASSDKAYGSHSKLPYREETALSGSHPYDVSKSCTDLIARTYFNVYGTPAAVTRCGNIYGPGDFNFSRIAPDTIRSALSGKKLMIRSDGKFTRDYVFVEDIVDGYLMLAEKLKRKNLSGEAFNLSNEKPVSVLQFTKMIYKAANRKPRLNILNKAKYEIQDQYLSSKKARRILGWKPKHSLDKGLKRTIEWYKTYLNK